ncbi:hypothetical protein CEXT_463951 [Caerostris extrusa]|uniref:Uncharacterized protein n=1 Tax=Caerostris extrusa TaxID=172846 RepID=A0AAV4M4X1_CAEEX|nr:hypothetical protein CEXT_463951 [Caerostris extrusa]
MCEKLLYPNLWRSYFEALGFIRELSAKSLDLLVLFPARSLIPFLPLHQAVSFLPLPFRQTLLSRAARKYDVNYNDLEPNDSSEHVEAVVMDLGHLFYSFHMTFDVRSLRTSKQHLSATSSSGAIPPPIRTFSSVTSPAAADGRRSVSRGATTELYSVSDKL